MRAAAALLLAAAAASAPAAAGPDQRVADCVLANLGAAYTEESARLVVESCRALVAAGASDGTGGGLFVRCEVAGDPEWAGHRLVTRRQCAAAAGRVRE